MKTLPLLTVPKDSPTLKERIEAFKVKHGIETDNCRYIHDEQKWLAVHRPSALEIGKRYGVTKDAPMSEICSHVARLIDESGNDAYGPTEREAIRNLCSKKQIVCEL